MADFKPTWLYVKQHSVTGLKYFGKTTSKDPHRYNGSGRYWLRHLKVHGKNITTVWCQLFFDKSELIEYAKNFSIKNNIVESKEWANLIPEAGYEDGGGIKGRIGPPHSEETKSKIREARKNQKSPMTGKSHSEETKEKIRQKRITQVFSEESYIKRSNSLKGHIFSKERNQKISRALTGRKFSPDTIEKMRISARARHQQEN
jgi:hypothetical protein